MSGSPREQIVATSAHQSLCVDSPWFLLLLLLLLLLQRSTRGCASAHLSLPKNVVYGHCLVTLPCTINETLTWLTSLPIYLNAEIILVVTM